MRQVEGMGANLFPTGRAEHREPKPGRCVILLCRGKIYGRVLIKRITGRLEPYENCPGSALQAGLTEKD